MRNILLESLRENEAGYLVPDLFLIFKKALFMVKANGHNLVFNISAEFNLEMQ